MTSYPSIQSSLSSAERRFISFVDEHAGRGDSLFEVDPDSGLPGDTVRMTVSGGRAADDVAERRHTVEYMSLAGDGHWQTVGSITHSVKEIEAFQGRLRELVSTFAIRVPGVPDGRFSHEEVEPVVEAALDRLGAVRLRPLRRG
jgi:hypothetical protein